MGNEVLAYFYAFGSVATFSVAALVYTHFSLKISALWMTMFKAAVSVWCSVPLLLIVGSPLYFPVAVSWPFLLSGALGLALGDFFLLSAYRRIGPARTLILFGFEPLVVLAW